MTASPKLYFLACSFPPVGRGNALTNACVANHLADCFDVEVVCIDEARGYLLSYQQDQSLVAGLNPRLKVHRVSAAQWWGLNEFLYGIGLLPCYYLNWAWSVWRGRDRLFREPGVLFAVYPVFSDLVLGYFLHRFRGYPLLVDFRDDFSGVMSRGWRRILRGFYRRLERGMVRAAAHVTVTTEPLKRDLMARHGLEEDRVSVVYNVVPPFEEGIERADCEDRLFTIVYAGAISRHQRPEILLKAYRLLVRQHPDLQSQIRVEIFGPESRYFRRQVRAHLGEGIAFRGFCPREEVVRQIAQADIGFLSLGDAALAYATPTKLFEYIDLEKPVLAVVPPGATRRLIEDMEIGLVADIDDVEGLAQHLYDLFSQPLLRRKFEANIRGVKDRFSAGQQVEKWKKVVRQIGSGSV